MRYVRVALTVAGFAAASLVSVGGGAPAGASATPTVTGGCNQAVTVKTASTGIGGVQPTTPVARPAPAVACATATTTAASKSYSGDPPMIYNGGPVLDTDGGLMLTPIFWAPTGYSFPSDYVSLIERYVGDVAHDSGLSTNVFAAAPQYYGLDATLGQDVHIKYQIANEPAVTDTDAFPTGACTPDTGAVYSNNAPYTSCLDDAQLQGELGNLGLTQTADHIYLLFLPMGVESCFTAQNNEQGGTCTTASALKLGAYCGYHGYVLNGSDLLVYAALPYPVVDSATGYGCNANDVSPNKDLEADEMISVTAHEANEATTDPELNAWFDAEGYEMADDCAYIYGTSEGGAGNTAWNQVINGDHYYTQEMFSNEAFHTKASTACIQKRGLPTAAITATPAITGVNKIITFSGSRSKDAYTTNGIRTYAWNFGDGATASDVSAKHSYSATGKYTVTLTVTDVDGWQGTTTKVVTINKTGGL